MHVLYLRPSIFISDGPGDGCDQHQAAPGARGASECGG